MSSDRPLLNRAFPPTRMNLLALAIFALWIIAVAYGAFHHVIWRDEMRALSLTLEAPNLLAVPAVSQGEGHPALWYVVLSLAHAVFRTNAVLGGTSFVLALIGAGLLFWKSPFPLWWKTLFIFSGLGVYEYAVMARDYALVMPLFFGLTMAIVAQKRRYWLIALLLFLAMQVDIYTTLLAPFFLLVLLRHWRQEDRAGRIGIAACWISAGLGLAAAVAAVYPPKHDLVTQALSGQIPLLKAVQLAIAAPGVQYLTLLYGHGHSAGPHLFLLNPDTLGPLSLVLTTVLVYGACLGLASDMALFIGAVVGLWVTCIFAMMIYPMHYRHAGVWIVFVCCLYWVKRSTPPKLAIKSSAPSLFDQLSWGMFTFLIVLALPFGVPNIYLYSHTPSSTSRALAQQLVADPALHGAIILPDPGEMAESLRYYVANPIYMTRERKFGRLANWTKTSTLDLSLDEMVDAARTLQTSSGKPIVFVLEHALEPGDHLICVGFNRSFRYTQADYDAFTRSTRIIPLGPALDETYSAYLLPLASPQTAPQTLGGGQADSEKKQAEHDNWIKGGRRAARLQCGTHPRADVG